MAKQTNKQKTHEIMLIIPGHKGNANQNHIKILPHSWYNSYHQEHHHQNVDQDAGEKGTLIHCW
jgi:hypothetical protein